MGGVLRWRNAKPLWLRLVAPSIYNSPNICYYVHRHRSTLFAREKCWRMGGEVNNH